MYILHYFTRPTKAMKLKNFSQLINDQNLKGPWFKSNPVCLCTYYGITSVIFLQAMIDVDELYRCPIAKEAQLRKDNKVLACTY